MSDRTTDTLFDIRSLLGAHEDETIAVAIERLRSEIARHGHLLEVLSEQFREIRAVVCARDDEETAVAVRRVLLDSYGVDTLAGRDPSSPSPQAERDAWRAFAKASVEQATKGGQLAGLRVDKSRAKLRALGIEPDAD